MKKIIALLLVVVMATMIFACGKKDDVTTDPTTTTNSSDTTATKPQTTEPTKPQTTEPTKPQTTEPTKPQTTEPVTPPETTEPENPPVKEITPYADIDFADGKAVDKYGKLTLEPKSINDAALPTIGKASVTFDGLTLELDAFMVKEKNSFGKLTFVDVESADMKGFVQKNGGISLEVFYIDKSTTNATIGVVCGTEKTGSGSSGWGLASTAAKQPYFCTGSLDKYYSTYADGVGASDDLIHVVCVYNEADWEQSIYVNGKLAGGPTLAGGFNSTHGGKEVNEGYDIGNVLFVGADPSARANYMIDFVANDLTVVDIKVYDKALSADEVASVFATATAMFN